MQSVPDLVAHHPFFAGMMPEHVALIAGCGTRVQVAPGAYVAREGEQADRFLAIRFGTVVIETHVLPRGPVALQTLGEGDVVGWSWLFPPHVWQFDVRARDAVEAVSFDGRGLRDLCDADPALGYALTTRLARLVSARLEATRRQLLDMYGPDRGR